MKNPARNDSNNGKNESINQKIADNNKVMYYDISFTKSLENVMCP